MGAGGVFYMQLAYFKIKKCDSDLKKIKKTDELKNVAAFFFLKISELQFSVLSEVTLTIVLSRSCCWKSYLWKTLPV